MFRCSKEMRRRYFSAEVVSASDKQLEEDVLITSEEVSGASKVS